MTDECEICGEEVDLEKSGLLHHLSNEHNYLAREAFGASRYHRREEMPEV